MSLFPSFKYASVLVYDKTKPSFKDFILGVKNDSTAMFTFKDGSQQPLKNRDVAIRYIQAAVVSHPWLANYLNPNTCLVPMPSSSPRLKGSLWPTERLCQSLVTASLGRSIEPLLMRTTRVAKSATCRSGAERPTAQVHYDSMSVSQSIVKEDQLTVIDDVITRGATSLAAHRRLIESFPDKKVMVFALARVECPSGPNFLDPHEGIVENFLSQPHRD